MYCSKCGVENKNSNKYCYNCGNKLDINNSVTTSGNKETSLVLGIIGMIIGVLEMIGIILLFMFLINFGNYEETTDSTLENINNVYDNSLIEL